MDGFVALMAMRPTDRLKANNFELCTGDVLFPGTHEIVVKLNVTNTSFFAVDYLSYSPPPDTDLSDKVIRIDDSDEAIKTLSEEIPVFSNETVLLYTNGSSLSVEFIGNYCLLPSIVKPASNMEKHLGKSLAWYGCTPTYPIWLCREPSFVVYSIDGNTNQTIKLEGATTNLTNQLLFTTPDLSSGKHELVATYLGNGRQQVPLCLDYSLVTRNGTSETTEPPDTVAPTEGHNITTSSPVVFTGGKENHLAPIVGGVVGAVVALSLVVLCTLWLVRRRHQSKIEMDLLSDVEDDDSPTPHLTPFPVTRGSQNDVTGCPHMSQTIHNKSSSSNLPATSASSSQNGETETLLGSRPIYDAELTKDGLLRPRRLLHHRDSGTRISVPVEEEIIEVPPTYTPS